MATDDARLLVRIEAQLRQFEKAMAQATGGADRAAGRIEKRFRTMERSLSGIGRNAFRGLFTSVAGLVGAGAIIRGFVNNTIEQEKALAQLNATLKSTGGAAGLTADDLTKLATGMQDLTTFGDEAVLSAEALLLTFTKIGGDIFPQATETILDMSTALGQDLKSSAVQLGKALQDPVLGITALRRVGVNFSDAQKDVIKRLVETGKLAEAQKLILQELQVEFGGSARAARDTLGGALQALGNAWGDLFELQGPAADNLRASIESLLETLKDDKFQASIQNLGSLLFRTLKLIADGAHLAGVGIGYLDGKINELFDDLERVPDTDWLEHLMQTATDRTEELRAKVNEIPEQIAKIEQAAKDGLIPTDESQRQIAILKADLDALGAQLANLASKTFVINVELHRRSEDASMEALAKFREAGIPPTVAAPAIESEPSATPRSTRGSGGGKSPKEKFDEDIRRIQERTAALIVETAAVGRSTFEAEKMLTVQQLLNEAKKAGLTITPQLTAQIEAEAEAHARATATLEDTERKYRELQEAQNFFAETAFDSFSEFIPIIETGNAALDKLIANLIEAAAQAAFLGQGPLAGLFGTSTATGVGGGILGRLFGSFGGKFAGGGTLGAGKWGIAGEGGRPEIIHGPARITPMRGLAGIGDMKISIDLTGANGDQAIAEASRAAALQGAKLALAQMSGQLAEQQRAY